MWFLRSILLPILFYMFLSHNEQVLVHYMVALLYSAAPWWLSVHIEQFTPNLISAKWRQHFSNVFLDPGIENVVPFFFRPLCCRPLTLVGCDETLTSEPFSYPFGEKPQVLDLTINENTRKSIQINENLWKSMKIWNIGSATCRVLNDPFFPRRKASILEFELDRAKVSIAYRPSLHTIKRNCLKF